MIARSNRCANLSRKNVCLIVAVRDCPGCRLRAQGGTERMRNTWANQTIRQMAAGRFTQSEMRTLSAAGPCADEHRTRKFDHVRRTNSHALRRASVHCD